jgi:hypothetical protein
MIITTKQGVRVDIQVKATARLKPQDAYQIDWTTAKDLVVGGEDRRVRFALAVVNVRRRMIFVFSDRCVRDVVVEAERGLGDHYSRPGRLELPYEDAARTMDLTVGEIAEGLAIAEADAEVAKDDDLFGEAS